jgi:hypothetical protein
VNAGARRRDIREDERMVQRVLLLLIVCAGQAHADQWVHTGLDMRTDLGTHHTRVPMGIRTHEWGGTIVVDPMFVLDGQHDLDLIGEYFFGPRIGVFLGWRWSALRVADGVHHQQRSIAGITGVGPAFFDNALRTSASLELATLWVKHGGGVDANWISADRNMHDSFGLGLFVRIEYARGL